MMVPKGCDKMLKRLNLMRDYLAEKQDEKLVSLWYVKGDYLNVDFPWILDKLFAELEELREALKTKGPDDILDEIIDVRNVSEMFLYILNDGKLPQQKVGIVTQDSKEVRTK